MAAPSCLLQGVASPTGLSDLQRGHLGHIILLCIPSSGTGRLPWPEALYFSSYPSDSIYRQGRVNPHISRVLGRLAAGILPAHGDNKHLMNDLPKSVSLQWKNNASGTALWLKTSFFNESSSITGNLTETPVFS